MKQVRGALNEKDSKLFKKRQEQLKKTEHGIITKLAKGVANGNQAIIEFLKDTKAMSVYIPFWTLCYSLAIATVILVS